MEQNKKMMNMLVRKIPLLLCGIFLTGIAAFDDGLFLAISFDLTNRSLVTLGTTIAAAVPMFFAIGAIKQSVIPQRETIFFYEKMLKHWAFWISSAILCFIVLTLKLSTIFWLSISSLTVGIFSLLAGIYLVFYALQLSGKLTNKTFHP